jgi:hypothetical protein
VRPTGSDASRDSVSISAGPRIVSETLIEHEFPFESRTGEDARAYIWRLDTTRVSHMFGLPAVLDSAIFLIDLVNILVGVGARCSFRCA